MEKWIESAYHDGYQNGYANGTEELKRLRSFCHREAGEHDKEYAEYWRDNTPFYGWCSQCKSPHSGRWAHMWEYCPWCGAKVEHKDNDPYPTGMEQEGE
jgi:hypothetical protein